MSSRPAFHASLFPPPENGGGAEDNRYLWPQAFRAIDEIRPTWFVGENVAGIATMVEGGLLTEMGVEGALFDEMDRVHRYGERSTFTIERICQDLEKIGYSVQPMLIPAAAVGAPHRRDRIFFLAHNDASSDGGNARVEGLRKRPTKVYATEFVTNTDCGRGREIPSTIHLGFADGTKSFGTCGERHVADSSNIGLPGTLEHGAEEEVYGEASGERGYSKCGISTKAAGRGGTFTDAYYERLSTTRESRGDGAKEWDDTQRSVGVFADDAWVKGTWWDSFPTFSPVFSGNDGLPFDVDRLTIPFSKWRIEALKAAGNAIVVQVMYRIFQAIEQVHN